MLFVLVLSDQFKVISVNTKEDKKSNILPTSSFFVFDSVHRYTNLCSQCCLDCLLERLDTIQHTAPLMVVNIFIKLKKGKEKLFSHHRLRDRECFLLLARLCWQCRPFWSHTLLFQASVRDTAAPELKVFFP